MVSYPLEVFETYPQKIPGRLTNREGWLDSHLTRFAVRVEDLKVALAEIYGDWQYEEYMWGWTWDDAEIIYRWADQNGKILGECFIERKTVEGCAV